MAVSSILDESNEISVYKLAEMLDDEQVEAVMAEAMDTVVEANAGAGKTRVLTSRVAYLLATGVPQNHIMLLTFTNKASREMIERVQEMLGGKKVRIMGGTFHHVAVIFLRLYAEYIGYKKNFSILDPDDAKSLIEEERKKYLKKNGIAKSKFPDKKVIYHYYSSAINRELSYEVINEEENEFPYDILLGMIEIIEAYVTRKKEASGMDFDDLLVNFHVLLSNEEIRKKISKQFPYILVDEYQDINGIQYEIIELLNKGNHNLFAVGDAKQAIYSWRGSNVQYIESFEKRHRTSQVLYITHNYRSDAAILHLAENSINHNFEKGKKAKITPYLPYKNKPTLHETQDDYKQADYIAETVRKHAKNGVSFKEMAILLRTNYLTRTIEKVFRQQGIPYKLLAGFSFFERKHVKDILAFLRFVHNQQDESAFIRMAGLFEGIGEKTIEKLFEGYKSAGYDLTALGKIKVSKNASTGVATMLSIVLSIVEEKTIATMIRCILREYYDAYLKRTEEDYRERMSDVNYLLEAAEGYGNLSDFLSEMILDEVEQKEQGDEVVTITTVHKAKGLEWEVVFLPYVNEGIFPSLRRTDVESIKEERRLFYVAVTRAKKQLHLSFTTWQAQSYKPMFPSSFIREISSTFYEEVK
ncbi:ATP-dependent helicase (plasmid) [Aneurinibacillus sp. Ricciae_BoGa-3]|uniref:ATP-dependent helicase n=1 Tax=Aneurinibacillus sp. Ricciae_BoGa-3 TaxID=3022697 RepID=UPI0023423B70|nr:ATP-dependent helicase [Aneurinibacillus sp. Ricciae_BoGa-3]WCK57231.1 ATP-dependent helicase [Aneurinibacillus sp. Ricciae_BoGa-3]